MLTFNYIWTPHRHVADQTYTNMSPNSYQPQQKTPLETTNLEEQEILLEAKYKPDSSVQAVFRRPRNRLLVTGLRHSSGLIDGYRDGPSAAGAGFVRQCQLAQAWPISGFGYIKQSMAGVSDISGALTVLVLLDYIRVWELTKQVHSAARHG